MNDCCRFEVGNVTLTTEHQYDKNVKMVFVHMSFEKISKATITNIRTAFNNLKEHYKAQGDLVVFGLTDNPQVVKLWGLLERPHQLTKLRNGQWLGSWLTEE